MNTLLKLSKVSFAYRALPVLEAVDWSWQRGQQWAEREQRPSESPGRAALPARFACAMFYCSVSRHCLEGAA